MDKEYKEMRIGKRHLIWGILWTAIGALMIITCITEWSKEYIWLVVMFGIIFLYGIFCCLEQINWYIKYDAEGFEISNAFGKRTMHSFRDIKSVKPLRKGAAILYMENPKRQYEIEPNVTGSAEFIKKLHEYDK